MSELLKVNKFSAEVSPKGEPKLFLMVHPYEVYPEVIARAYTELDFIDYLAKSPEIIEDLQLDYEEPTLSKEDVRGRIKRILHIREISVVDLTEGDEPHS